MYGNLEEEFLMKQSESIKFIKGENNMNNEEVLVRKQSVYGSVQAAIQYFKKLRDVLIENMGFEKCLINQYHLSSKEKLGM